MSEEIKNDWIDVEDFLPKETDRYKIKNEKGGTSTVWFIIDITGHKAWSYTYKQKITHWKKLKS